jgi:hypothetical protein
MPPTYSSDFDTAAAGTSDSTAASERGRSEKPKKKKSDVVMVGDRIAYDDGVQVDVTKIRHGKLTQLDTEIFDSEAEAGAPYVDFTVRIVNESSQRLALATSDLVTYGPNDDEAEEVLFATAEGDITGTLKPRRSKSLRLQYIIPKKHQRNVRMEFHFEDGRDPAVFEGSVT